MRGVGARWEDGEGGDRRIVWEGREEKGKGEGCRREYEGGDIGSVWRGRGERTGVQ